MTIKILKLPIRPFSKHFERIFIMTARNLFQSLFNLLLLFHLKSIVVMLSKKRSKNGTWRSDQSWFIVTYLVMKILSISSPFCQFLLAQSMFVHSSHMWVVNKIHIHYDYNNNKNNNVIYTHRTILKLTCASASAFAFFGSISYCRV